jgi:hypothetical protein
MNYPAPAELPHSVRAVTVAAATPARVEELGYCPAASAAGEFIASGLSVEWLSLLSASFDAEIDAQWPRRPGWWQK